MSTDETIGPPLITGLRYKSLLGSGGFAHVYRYEQTGLGRDVAVKVIHGFDDAARRYFSSEANLMARLSSHPHVVPVYQVGASDDGRPYLVMQLCPSPNLSQRLRAAPLPVATALEIGVQVAGAIETAHRLGILHRDIKPSNILFSEYGRPLLADFGIAQSLEATAATAGQMPAFSPLWAPPEQAVGQGFAATADVYSLCSTLWATLTGRAPLGPTRPGLAPQTMARQDVPAELVELLRNGLAEDPSARPHSALELARGLQRIQAQLGLAVTPVELWNDPHQNTSQLVESDDRTRVTTLPEPEPGPTVDMPAPVVPAPPLSRNSPMSPQPRAPLARRDSRRTWWVWLLLLLLLVVLAAAAALLWPRSEPTPPPPAAPSTAVTTPTTATTAGTTRTVTPRPTSATTATSGGASGGGMSGDWDG